MSITPAAAPAATTTTNSSDRHLVLGAGAIGFRLATELAQRGGTVRIVTRSGNGPEHPNVERIASDVSDTPRLVQLAQGFETVFNCVNPPYPKWATQWPSLTDAIIAACAASGARLVTLSNLYGYAADSSPMRATDELAPPTRKGAIRVATWRAALDAHEAGRISMTEVRASDFIGPGVGANGHVGDRFVPRVRAEKPIWVLGRSDVEHSWSYVDDVVATLIAAADDPRALGRAWHVPTGPPLSFQRLAAEFAAVAGTEPVAVKSVPNTLLRAIGVVSPMMRELPEMRYQFDRPFVIDASDTTDAFGITPTPLHDQLRATINAYREVGQPPTGAGSTVRSSPPVSSR